MPIDLRRLFEQALKVSLASPLVFSCGAGIDTRSFDAIDCESNGSSFSISNLKPAMAVDYAELRRLFMFGGTPDPMQKDTLLASFGTRCGTAADKPACEAALDALKGTKGFGSRCLQICTEDYLATTTGDTLGTIDTLEALKAFLGTIDTPHEALLLASTRPVNFACGDKSKGAVRKTQDGFEVVGYDGHACGEGASVNQRVLAVGSDGSVSEISSAILERGQPGCAIGRRPCGLRAAYGPLAANPLARHFVAAAHLEAASVPAFLRLRDELALHGAPKALQLGALLSAGDEVRHARAVSALARRFGGRPVPPRVRSMPLRPLAEVARDNAVEGCVRETFGALVAHRQAQKAKDPAIAAELRGIAQDETRHASLSWEVHAWALQALPRAERAGLKAAQAEAVRALRQEQAADVDPALVEQAGMPPADEAVALVDALAQTLWG